MNYEPLDDFNHEPTAGVYHMLFKKRCRKCDVAIDFTILHERIISSHRVKRVRVLELDTLYHLNLELRKPGKTSLDLG
jgi:hypothetical protein